MWIAMKLVTRTHVKSMNNLTSKSYRFNKWELLSIIIETVIRLVIFEYWVTESNNWLRIRAPCEVDSQKHNMNSDSCYVFACFCMIRMVNSIFVLRFLLHVDSCSASKSQFWIAFIILRYSIETYFHIVSYNIQSMFNIYFRDENIMIRKTRIDHHESATSHLRSNELFVQTKTHVVCDTQILVNVIWWNNDNGFIIKRINVEYDSTVWSVLNKSIRNEVSKVDVPVRLFHRYPLYYQIPKVSHNHIFFSI